MELNKIDFMIREKDHLSKAKANSLYWLGRYAERVYMSLHLLRKYYDADIEANSNTAYASYCNHLNIEFNEKNPSEHIGMLLYGKDISNSLLCGLNFANDNALVLRGELTSETLSYIQIARYHMQYCDQINESNITSLQVITDNLLAFWGSVGERILNETVRDFLLLGRFIERLDMEIRFKYSSQRIIKTYFTMRKIIEKISKACDSKIIEKLDELIIEKASDSKEQFDDEKILNALCNLLII